MTEITDADVTDGDRELLARIWEARGWHFSANDLRKNKIASMFEHEILRAVAAARIAATEAARPAPDPDRVATVARILQWEIPVSGDHIRRVAEKIVASESRAGLGPITDEVIEAGRRAWLDGVHITFSASIPDIIAAADRARGWVVAPEDGYEAVTVASISPDPLAALEARVAALEARRVLASAPSSP